MTDYVYCWRCNDFCRVAYNSHRDDLPTCAVCDCEEIDDYASCVLCGGEIYRSDDSTQRDGHLAHDTCIAGELERAKRDADEYAADCEFDRRRDAMLERADMARMTAKDR